MGLALALAVPVPVHPRRAGAVRRAQLPNISLLPSSADDDDAIVSTDETMWVSFRCLWIIRILLDLVYRFVWVGRAAGRGRWKRSCRDCWARILSFWDWEPGS